MRRCAAAGLAVLTAGVVTACSGSAAGGAAAVAKPETSAGPATTAPVPEPYPVAEYPTPADTDVAFVSEVAPLESVMAYLTHDPYILPTDLTDVSARLAHAGQWACGAYDGTNIDSVAAEIPSVIQADEIDPVPFDAIDAAAFIVAAAGVYCPERLVDLGEGSAMTGGVRREPVKPLCPTAPPVTVAVSPIQLESYSGLHSGTWTYTLTNGSAYGAVVELEERVLAPGYVGEWDSPEGEVLLVAPAFYVPAGGSVSADGNIDGVYAWEVAEYRIASWLPVDCAVELR